MYICQDWLHLNFYVASRDVQVWCVGIHLRSINDEQLRCMV